MRGALVLSSLLMITALAGCLNGDANGNDPALDAKKATLGYDVTNPRSVTLTPGDYYPLPGLDIYVDVPLPMQEGGSAINPADPPQAHIGLFLPDIEGCNFNEITDMEKGLTPGSLIGGEYASEDPKCKVPIIADAGPYYRTPDDAFRAEGDVPAAERNSGRLGEWLIENFVPKGYGVAQISVMGSGLSNHCFDMFGLAEQLGVTGAVDHLGGAGYSNGAVGLIGRSYDGSTPWMAAAHGSPYLKTIVPISGLSGLGDLVTWNGASETRVALFQNVVYAQFGLDSHELATDAATHASCPDWTTSSGWGALGYASGDEVINAEGTYWAERTFVEKALANYDGSLFMIHGLQDDNVDPHAGWIAELALRANGNDVKAMWGQWYHSYPDRVSEHGFNGHPDSIRMDWAEMMLEWFDHYLMGTGEKPDLVMQIQQENGPWREEKVWPPTDAYIEQVTLGTGSLSVGPTESTVDLNLGPISDEHETIIGGFSTVTMQVTPTGPGGQIYVELRDGTENKDFGLSYGVGELRHLTGEGAAVIPGQTYTVNLPFQLFDAALPAGHDLVLRISSSGNGFLPSPVVTPVSVDLAASTLHLSTLSRGPEAYMPVPLWYYYNATGQMFQVGSTAEGADDLAPADSRLVQSKLE